MTVPRLRFWLVLATLAAVGCGPSYEIVRRPKASEPESKTFSSKHHSLEIADTPGSSSPEIAVRVQELWFTIERRKKVEQDFKKYSDGKLEPVPGTAKESIWARVTDKQEWKPSVGASVTFRIPSAGKDVQVETDESGIARFSVAPFCEEWIEGRDLAIEVKATLPALEDPTVWTRVQGKVDLMPKVLEGLKGALKLQDREFTESLNVRSSTLEAIFEKK
jgi:hypothetical protein